MIEPGRSFDRAAVEYDRGRPRWPEAVVDAVPVAGATAVLDLAAGTGKLTQLLARRFPRVVAVEPLDGMRAILERRAPEAEVLPGAAEAIPLADEDVDAVFVAQAFHWFATDAAVAEIARVLRPAGLLVLLWQEPSKELPSPLPDAYRRRLQELHESVPPPAPKWRETLLRGPFESVEDAAPVRHEQVSDREAVLAFAASVSWIAHRPDEERRRVLDELAALLPDAEYRFPMQAEITWARRR